MQLSKKEKVILQKILTEQSFDIMNRIASAMLLNWNNGPIAGENEFETLKNAIGRDERKHALVAFLKELERLAHGN